jgi:Uma2 family endonuclease
MTLPLRDAFHHTYADYFSWNDEGRYELINGIAYVKEPPAPTRFHQELVGELHYQVKLALEGERWRAYVAPFDVRLPKAGEADALIDTVVQPDVLIVRDLSKLDDRGMRGAPDWIAEVLSPTTARHDEVIKIPVYERAGVLEVWLIHPVERALTVYRLRNGRYTRPIILELKGRTAITALPGVSIDWGRILRMLE